MIAYADLASRTRRIWIIELTRTVCPGTKQHRIMHSRNPRRRYFSFFFFLPLPFFSIFISTRTSVQNYTERRETEKFQDGNLKNKLFKIFMKLFEKFFTRISWMKLNEKFTHFDIPRNSKNLNFRKILKEIFSNAILSHICEYSINYL